MSTLSHALDQARSDCGNTRSAQLNAGEHDGRERVDLDVEVARGLEAAGSGRMTGPSGSWLERA